MLLPATATTADEELMHAYAVGHADAFERLYDRHQMRLWRYIFRSVGDSATADDLAQDVWLRVAGQAVRAFPLQLDPYPAALKKLAHFCGVNVGMSAPMVFQRLSTVRSDALRRPALSLEKAFSIGLRSGL